MEFHIAINLERMDRVRRTWASIQAPHARDGADGRGRRLRDRLGRRAPRAGDDHRAEPVPDPDMVGRLRRTGSGWAPCRRQRGLLAPDQAWRAKRRILDLVSGGRLEFGIGSGAYQREFDRMAPGRPAGRRLAIHAGDAAGWCARSGRAMYEHDGDYWQFPAGDIVPEARAAGRSRLGRGPRAGQLRLRVRPEGCNLMSWPLTHADASEVAGNIAIRLDAARAQHGPDWQGTWAMMRHSAVWDNEA